MPRFGIFAFTSLPNRAACHEPRDPPCLRGNTTRRASTADACRIIPHWGCLARCKAGILAVQRAWIKNAAARAAGCSTGRRSHESEQIIASNRWYRGLDWASTPDRAAGHPSYNRPSLRSCIRDRCCSWKFDAELAGPCHSGFRRAALHRAGAALRSAFGACRRAGIRALVDVARRGGLAGRAARVLRTGDRYADDERRDGGDGGNRFHPCLPVGNPL